MAPFSILADLDRIEDRRSRRCSAIPNLALQFAFKPAEEAFCRRVVAALAFARHARNGAVLRKKFTEISARILTPTIGVKYETCGGLPILERSSECVHHEFTTRKTATGNVALLADRVVVISSRNRQWVLAFVKIPRSGGLKNLKLAEASTVLDKLA